MKRNMYEWLRELPNQEHNTLPLIIYPGLELAGKTITDIVTDGESQYQAIKALSEKYPTAAAITIMDLSLEAEAFGSNAQFSDNEVPTVIGSIVKSEEDAKQLKVPKVGDGRSGAYLEAARLSAENITDRPVLGELIGPYSLAGRLMDMTEIMIELMVNPDYVKTVLEKCTEFLIEYAKAFKNTGVNGIIIAEPAAGLLGPDACHNFSSVYVKRIIEAVQDESFVVLLHNCGNTAEKLVETMASTTAKGLHFGNAVDMNVIMPQVPADIVAFGNIEPSGVFKLGTTEEMKSTVTKLLSDMKPYNNFVLSSGCDVPVGTPLENLDAFFEAAEEFKMANK